MEKNNEEEIIFKIKEFNQEHLIKAIKLCKNEEEKALLIKNILDIDFKLLKFLHEKTANTEYSNNNNISYNDVEPLNSMTLEQNISKEEKATLMNIGLQNIYQGHFALFILAGGQGSRLNFEFPKGMYSINMPSNKSLFEYLFSRVKSIENFAKTHCKNNINLVFNTCKIIIQTSEENNETTTKFLKDNSFFGLNECDIIIFPQEMIPAVDINGKILMRSPIEIFKNPNGNGGCFSTLKHHNILKLCFEKQIKYLHVISIDNPLIKTLDPLFLGWHVNNKFVFSAKYIEKKDPNEAIGVFLKFKGKAYMLDYADACKEIKEKIDEFDETKLKYRAGNILNYIININHLDKILNNENNLKILNSEYHCALKNIECVNLNGEPSTVKGYKFEIFFNSIFQFCPEDNSLALYGINREDEFSPVKNKDGEKTATPTHCRNDFTNMFIKHLKLKNIAIILDKESNYELINFNSSLNLNKKIILEIDFLLMYDSNFENFEGEKIIKTKEELLLFNLNENVLTEIEKLQNYKYIIGKDLSTDSEVLNIFINRNKC